MVVLPDFECPYDMALIMYCGGSNNHILELWLTIRPRNIFQRKERDVSPYGSSSWPRYTFHMNREDPFPVVNPFQQFTKIRTATYRLKLKDGNIFLLKNIDCGCIPRRKLVEHYPAHLNRTDHALVQRRSRPWPECQHSPLVQSSKATRPQV